VESKHSVDETVRRVLSVLGEKGIKLFTIIDHAAEATSAGLRLRPTKVVIFGSPKAGTALMQAAPTTAIDLPLKALVWQDDEDRTWLAWNTAEHIQKRHGFPEELVNNIAPVAALLRKAAE
jgi:uncharacterized protein (DUF302 family)